MPQIGDIVHYVVSKADAEFVNERRHINSRNGGPVFPGQVVPAIVVRFTERDTFSGQAFLDGADQCVKR